MKKLNKKKKVMKKKINGLKKQISDKVKEIKNLKHTVDELYKSSLFKKNRLSVS